LWGSLLVKPSLDVAAADATRPAVARRARLPAGHEDAAVEPPFERFNEETNPKKYHDAAWPVVRHLYGNVFMCQLALAQMNAACDRAPDNASYRVGLGMAQYRLGKYHKERCPEARETLAKCDQNHPATLAFLGMAQRQLGEKEQARTTLARLRGIMKKPEWATNLEAAAFLREAAELIEGEPAQLKP
jgi:hypothetical protein